MEPGVSKLEPQSRLEGSVVRFHLSRDSALPQAAKEENAMYRQIAAVVLGVVLAIAVIYAVFDERVSFRTGAEKSQVTQSVPSN